MKTKTPPKKLPKSRALAGIPEQSMLPLWRRIYQEFSARSEQWGISPNLCMTMAHLHLNPENAEPAALAKANYFPRQTMTFILDALEKKNLAVRRPHPVDRRRKIVQLSPKGQKLADAMLKSLLRFETKALQAIEGTDLNALQTLLNRYADALTRQNEQELHT